MSSKTIVSGFLYGAAIWLVYASLEFAVFSILPMLMEAQTELNGPLWRAAAMTTGIYALAGGILGAAISAAVASLSGAAEESPRRMLQAASLPLPVIFAVDAVRHWPVLWTEGFSAAVAVLLVAAAGLSLRSEPWRPRIGFLTGPLTVCALLLAPRVAEIVLADQPGGVRLAAILAISAVVLLTARTFRARQGGLSSRPALYAGAAALLMCITGAAGALLSPGLPALPARNAAVAARKPNIVLIVLDTVRADHTSVYGYERDTTPFLRELAKESTLYTHAVAVADQTLPTHASMFTGLYPATHGAHFAPPARPLGQPLAENFTTLAEVLRASGYRTMGVAANSGYLSPLFGLTQGFEVFDWRAPIKTEASFRVYPRFLRKSVGEILDRFTSTAELERVVRPADEISAAARVLVDQAGKSPYFLFLNYMDAHMIYAPPEPFRSAFPCADLSRASLAQMHAIRTGVVGRTRKMTAAEQQCLVSQYDAGIAYIDAELRRLIGSLKARGQFENTLLIVTGDHGEALGHRNHVGHGGISVYQEEIAVPLLVKYPSGSHAASQVDEYVSQVDFLPTILEAAALPALPGLPGRSMRTVSGAPSRPLVSVSFPDESTGKLNAQFRRIEEALVFDGTKLVVSTSGKREMFDLRRDREEENNLYQGGNPQAARLMAMFEQWKKITPAAHLGTGPAGDRGTIERLKSLGYVQ